MKFMNRPNTLLSTWSFIQSRRLHAGLCLWGLFLALGSMQLSAQTRTISTGSFIINMGVTPQTVDNGLKPYGMVYDLLTNYSVTIIWSIEPSKSKDGIDFSHNGVDYRGGTFVIPAEFRTPAVDARIAYWQGEGVVGATTVSPLTIPFFTSYNLQSAPRWTLDAQNGKIAEKYFQNAQIPPVAYGGASNNWKDPADLDCCDDLFVMPHADPVWSTHQRLLSWNLDCQGGIWAACHATSALENMVNPADRNVQTNFLTVKDPNWQGTNGAYTQSNALVLWGSHNDASPPYTFNPAYAADPVAQYMGTPDAAMQNGSEQIYLTRQGIVANPTTYSPSAVARWNPGAKILVYDPTQGDVTNPNTTTLQNVAAAIVYGRGFDDPNRGYVMYEAGHSHSKSTGPANIAAQRAFFNFGFLVANEKAPVPDVSAVPTVFNAGNPQSLSISVSGGIGPYTISWTSACGGSFSPNNSAAATTTTFTPPSVTSNTPCVIRVTITDDCGRQAFGNVTGIIQSCQLTFNNTINAVSCNGGSDGSINMGITGSTGPFTWDWTRVSPASTGSGSGTTISGLSAGTYNVSVTSNDGCEGTFTAVVTQPNVLTASATPANYLCFGQTGAINLAVNGGTAPYTYNWTGPGGPYTTQNLSGLTAGTYNVTVTDDNGCTAPATATVTGPAAAVAVALDTKTDVACNSDDDGTISITASGGTPGYTYLWTDGSTDEDRTGLAPGSYTVTVTDANGCTGTLTETISEPPALIISVSKADPTCPPGSSPPVNSDGEVTVTANGGVAPYNVSWTGPSSGNPSGDEIAASGGNYTISNLQAGTYTVTVTDDNGCTATLPVTLTNLTSLPPTPVINN